jgi:O-acetyl-ADP-ribose deacetylase (regulator of RNase III)
MKTILRDKNQGLVDAWMGWFKDEPGEVVIECGDIFDGPADAVVSPANSFGIMNGGIDQAYTERFGTKVQARVQKEIRERYWGELPVGAAVIVRTDDPEFPWCISAPTMRVPEQISRTLNAYLAFRAVRLAVQRHNAENELPIRSILCPGLGTTTGKLDYDLCARQMLCAYRAPAWPRDPAEDFTTPWALGRFMRGEADMAGVTTIHQRRRYDVVLADDENEAGA